MADSTRSGGTPPFSGKATTRANCPCGGTAPGSPGSNVLISPGWSSGGNEPQRELDILGLIVRLDDACDRSEVLFGHVDPADREPRDARAFWRGREGEDRTFVEREIAVLEQPGDRLRGRSRGDGGLAAAEEESAAEHQGAAHEKERSGNDEHLAQIESPYPVRQG